MAVINEPPIPRICRESVELLTSRLDQGDRKNARLKLRQDSESEESKLSLRLSSQYPSQPLREVGQSLAGVSPGLLGDCPTGVADVIHGLHHRRPIIVTF